MRILLSFILFLFCIETFSQTGKTTDAANDSTVYHFKIKLTKAISLPPNCGYLAFALLQKFEVIATDFPNYKNKFVLIVQECPEFLGRNFFETNKIYETDVATNSDATFKFTFINNYKKEKLPTFWSRKIVKSN